MSTKVTIKVNPESVSANVVIVLTDGPVITPIRLNLEEADKARRWLLGLDGANHKGPATLHTPQGSLRMTKETWAPMLEELNEWYSKHIEGGKK